MIAFLQDRLVWSCSPRDSQESSPAPQCRKINSLVLNLLYGPILTPVHDYWKNHSFDCTDLIWWSAISAFSYAKFVIAFPPRSKCLLISWLQTPSAVILEHKKIKSVTVSNFSSSICHEVILVFFSVFQIPYSSLYKLKHYFCLVVILWIQILKCILCISFKSFH